jgi:hypothetical protein
MYLLLSRAWEIVLKWNSATPFSTLREILIPILTWLFINRKRLGAWRMTDLRSALITTLWGIAVIALFTVGAWIVAIPVAAWDNYLSVKESSARSLTAMAKALYDAQKDRNEGKKRAETISPRQPKIDKKFIIAMITDVESVKADMIKRYNYCSQHHGAQDDDCESAMLAMQSESLLFQKLDNRLEMLSTALRQKGTPQFAGAFDYYVDNFKLRFDQNGSAMAGTRGIGIVNLTELIGQLGEIAGQFN